MKRLPLGIVGLIVFMALFFNLERLDYISKNELNIRGFVYVLATVWVSLILVVPALRKLSPITLLGLSAASYLIWRVSFFSLDQWWGGMQSYVTIAEMVLLLVSVAIARVLGGWLEDFAQAVENITFARLKRVRTLEEVEDDIEEEMYRSRRYQHPLTVVLAKPNIETLRLAVHRTVEEVQKAMLLRYVSVSLMTRALYGHLRRTDWLLERSQKNQFVFILPETRGDRAGVVVERIHQTAQEMGVDVACGVATFPDDALTFEGLLSKAEENMPYAGSIPGEVVAEITPPKL